jgi:DNA-binding CsgD family transcriptional regulator
MKPNSHTLRTVAFTTLVLILSSALIYVAYSYGLIHKSNWWALFIALPAVLLITVAAFMIIDRSLRNFGGLLGFLGGAFLITSGILFTGGDFAISWPLYAIWGGLGLGMVCLSLLQHTQSKVSPAIGELPVPVQMATEPSSNQTQFTHTPTHTIDLSDRELEVLALLSSELSPKEIAGQLVVAPSTVKAHLRNVYRKLGVNTRKTAVERARVLGLLR